VDELGSFETLAQIALGIAGFSGVVVAVADRPAQQQQTRADSLRILSLLVVSLGALVLALLPSGLALAHVPRASIWRLGSAAAASFWVAWLLYFPRRLRREAPEVLFPTSIGVSLGVLLASNLCLQVLNTAGLFHERAAAAYYFGIVAGLVFSAAVFANVVFRRPGASGNRAPGRKAAEGEAVEKVAPERRAGEG
jgi:hypothetical protein